MVCILFYIQKNFPRKGKGEWMKNMLVIRHICELIRYQGENLNTIMNEYFQENFVLTCNHERIPFSFIEYYKDYI